MKERAGYLVMSGNLFDTAVMKVSVIDDDFRKRYLSNPTPEAFEGKAIVFDGPEDYHDRINDPALGIDERLRAVHPQHRHRRLPGLGRGREHAAARRAHRRGITSLPTIGDGRQSGTSARPSILNASPEAAVGGGLALLKTDDPSAST